jgi:flagellar M-ring protein FliF
MMNSLQKTWVSLSFAQRVTLGAVLVAVFGAMLFIGQTASRPAYAVLFSNLEAEDAGAVTSKLREQKVDYHITQSGRAIEVPADKVYDLRLTMATEGLPRGGSVGFELFDKTNFTATDFTQHLNYRRALEGELTRTINRLDGVVESRVHLAMPEKQLFQEKEEPATASVVLHLRPGYELDNQRVAGLVHLVSSAVEGLKPQNVTIHNAQGELLSGGETSSPHTENQVQLQEQYERRLETDLQRMVERVLGPGRAVIRVSAELDWDQDETTSVRYRPGGVGGRNLPVEEQSTRETYGPGSPRPPRGIAGITSNLTSPEPPRTGGGPGGVGQAASSGQYSNTHLDNHYAVDKVEERRVVAPGKVKRLSVAVLVDQTIAPAQQIALRKALTAAAGLDVAKGGRGDRIELSPIPFDKSTAVEETKAADKAAKQGIQTELVRNGSAVLIVILVMLGSLLVGKKLLTPGPDRLDAVVSDPLSLHQGSTRPDASDLTYSAPPLARTATLTDRVRQRAAERPEEVARQLQSWLAE